MQKITPPNSDWKIGDPVVSPTDTTVEFDLNQLSQQEVYKLLIGSVVPRPIAFVSTVNLKGEANLAPFSFFNIVSSDPPCLMVSITRKPDGLKKDTLINIEETKEFVLNTVGEWMVEPMNQCSGDYPYGVSELAAVGLTGIASVNVKPERVKESPVQMECRLEKLVEIGDAKAGASTMVIGRILRMHIHDHAYSAGRVLIEKIKPVSRLAGNSYGVTRESFDLNRPSSV